QWCVLKREELGSTGTDEAGYCLAAMPFSGAQAETASTKLPEGSFSRIGEPPGPVTMSLRNPVASASLAEILSSFGKTRRAKESPGRVPGLRGLEENI